MSILILIAIAFLLMWLLLIRPQRRRQGEQVRMQESLSVGDEVVTAGGLYGTVERLDEDEVAVEIADGVVVRIARRAIAGVIREETENEEELGEEFDEDEEDEQAVESEAEPEPTERRRS
jgi:preprotein translocase subunit YajC